MNSIEPVARLRPRFAKGAALVTLLLLPFIVHAAWGYIETRRLSAAIRSIDARLPVYDEATLEERRSLALSQDRMMAALSGALGLIALVLTAVGVYGVIAYSVGRRTAEIGIRMALGATAASVRWLVVRDTLALVGIGGAISSQVFKIRGEFGRIFRRHPHKVSTGTTRRWDQKDEGVA